VAGPSHTYVQYSSIKSSCGFKSGWGEGGAVYEVKGGGTEDERNGDRKKEEV
jgi:hypothetical protein